MLSFSKEDRLLKRHEFRKTLDSRFKVVTPHLVVMATPSDKGALRMGLIVSRKVGIAGGKKQGQKALKRIFPLHLGS